MTTAKKMVQKKGRGLNEGLLLVPTGGGVGGGGLKVSDAGSGTCPLGAGRHVGSFAGYSFCNPNSLILGVGTVILGKMALNAALVSFDSCASGGFFFFLSNVPR